MLFASTIVSSSCLKSMFVSVYAWSFLCWLKIVIYFTLSVFADGLFVEKVAKFIECLTSVRDSVLHFIVHLGICLGETSRLEYGIPTKLVWTSGLYNTTLKRKNGMRERERERPLSNTTSNPLTLVFPLNNLTSFSGPSQKAMVQRAYADLSSYPHSKLFNPSKKPQ